MSDPEANPTPTPEPSDEALASPPPDEDAIKKLLVKLHSRDSHQRWEAAKALAQLQASNEQIINALKYVAAKDFDFVRQAAREAIAANEAVIALGKILPAFDVSSSPVLVKTEPQPPFHTQPDFWWGFFVWWVVNGLVFSIANFGFYSIFLNVFVLPANLIVLIVAAFKRRRFAGGILAALGVNFAISLISGAFTNGVCGIPFFIR